MDLNPVKSTTTATARDATAPTPGAVRDALVAVAAVKASQAAAMVLPELAPIAHDTVLLYGPALIVGAVTAVRKAVQNWMAKP